MEDAFSPERRQIKRTKRERRALLPACSLSTCCGSTARSAAAALEERRARLRMALGSGKALRFSEHLEGDGEAIFRHACALGLEGIVSKRRDARYRSGRSLTWLKIKNPITSGDRETCETLAVPMTVKAEKSSR